MILSMTGFGDAQLERPGFALSLEIRTLNSRYFKAGLRLPDFLGFLESDIEKWLRRRISRGTVNYTLKVRQTGEYLAQEVDVPALRGYLRQLAAVQAAGSGPGTVPGAGGEAGLRYTVDLATLLTLPGVCRPREDEVADPEQWRAPTEELTERALERLMTMRRTEGAAVWGDLEKQCRLLLENLEAVTRRAPGVVADYGGRLRERINMLLSAASLSLGQDALIREVAVFAERCDISEELTRLRGHVEQFLAAGRTEEAAGRKLEFLSQEMLRETNTIGSKANDAEILRRIVEMKGAVDRIKEQVQNVE